MNPPRPPPPPPAPDVIAGRKKALRAKCRAALAAIPKPDREAASREIVRRLVESPEFMAARAIMGFVAMPSEPDLLPLLVERASAERGTTLYLPRWNPATLEYEPAAMDPAAPLHPGPFGVPEPDTLQPGPPHAGLDLILVPGLAFDRQGRRLGRGRGFYDRLLARSGAALRWGVGFDLQIVDEVPIEAHDVNLNLLVTPGSRIPIPPGPSLEPLS